MKKIINKKFFSWLLYILGYSLVLIIVSLLFDSIKVDLDYFGLYALLASLIIYILNQTIKPILLYITLPITALTWGLFYPIINVIILYITSFILQSKFVISGFIIPFLLAILISFLNILIDINVIKPIINRGKDYE